MRKAILILCLAFVVVCFAFPCFILPFGEYKKTETSGDTTVTTSMKFGMDGKVRTYINGEEFISMYYKLKGNKIITSFDDTFETTNETTITSMYDVNGYKNYIGMGIAIGVGVLDLILICTIPSKRR